MKSIENKTSLILDLFFCLVFMPILVILGPAHHWLTQWPLFFILTCVYMYGCYFTLLHINIPKLLIDRRYKRIGGIIAVLVALNYVLSLYPLPDMDFVTPALSEYQTRVRNFGVSVSLWLMFSLVMGYSLSITFVKELYEQLLLRRKIEAQREYPITWAQAAKNSGGEGFLTAFVLLSSLLYYMRRDETDIFADRNEGKVLVMDNPFAQTNAAHLLKPLMDMADKMNTQLICFSGLGGSSIYERFDNIYVLNLVASKLRGGMQYLRGEHLRGTEEELLVSAQLEVIGQEKLVF